MVEFHVSRYEQRKTELEFVGNSYLPSPNSSLPPPSRLFEALDSEVVNSSQLLDVTALHLSLSPWRFSLALLDLTVCRQGLCRLEPIVT